MPIDHEHQPVGENCPQSDEGEPLCICIREDRDTVGHFKWVAVALRRRPTWHISMQTHASRVLRDPQSNSTTCFQVDELLELATYLATAVQAAVAKVEEPALRRLG
jgi:hypothetical protein